MGVGRQGVSDGIEILRGGILPHGNVQIVVTLKDRPQYLLGSPGDRPGSFASACKRKNTTQQSLGKKLTRRSRRFHHPE